MGERGIEVGDQITSEDRDGVLAIYDVAEVKKRGGIYTCTTKSGVELRLRCLGNDVHAVTYSHHSSFRRTVAGDGALLSNRRNVEKLRGLTYSARPYEWTPEQVSAVLAAWPKDAAK